jgi:hypothetical protein
MTPHLATSYPGVPLPAGHGPMPFSIEGVTLRHLRGAEVAQVLHLRDEIDLSVHSAAGPQFDALEKKETNAVSSSVSSLMAS